MEANKEKQEKIKVCNNHHCLNNSLCWQYGRLTSLNEEIIEKVNMADFVHDKIDNHDIIICKNFINQ